MSDSTGGRRVRTEAGTSLGSPVHAEGPEIDRLRREQGELWDWVHQLQRLAEAGLQARGLAHDLGNTLTSLMAGSELALQQAELPDMRRALRSNLELSRTAARRLHSFVHYTTHGAPEERTGIRLPEVVEDALCFLSHPVRKAQVAIECDYAAASDARVPGSRPELLQVVGTALLAVIEGFGTQGGILQVHVEELEDEVVLHVRRAAVAGAAGGAQEWWCRGSGLELTVARRIVASLGGRIDLGHGAPTSLLRLPTVSEGTSAERWREAPGSFTPRQHPACDRARRA